MIFTDKGKGKLQKSYEENNGINCAFWDDLGYPQLWWQDTPFRISSDLAEIFANETFQQELQTTDKCNNECSQNGKYSSDMFMKQEMYNKSSMIEPNIVNILVAFTYIFIGIFCLGVGLFIGIKWKTLSSIQK